MPSTIYPAAGIAWASEEEAERDWGEKGAGIPDLPVLTEENARYFRYFGMIVPGESWDSFTDRVGKYLTMAEAPGDIKQALFGDPMDGDRKSFPVLESNRELAQRALAAAGAAWSADCAEPLVHDAYLGCARTLSLWSYIPSDHEAHHADFLWALLRCFFAGAGFPAWARLATEIRGQYPDCPFDPAETRAQWDEALVSAHRSCGCPVQVGWLPWRSVVQIWDDGGNCQDLHRGLVALHVFKHVRLTADATRMRILYRGAVEIALSKASSQAFSGNQGITARTKLGMPAAPGKGEKDPMDTPLLAAWGTVAAKFSLADLPTLKPLRDLPGYYLHGEWSRLEPAPVPPGSWSQHGVRACAVKEAHGGVVRAVDQEPELLLNYEFRVAPATADTHARQAEFEAVCPATYPVVMPGAVLMSTFPHLDLSWTTDHRAFFALILSPLIASQLRPACPELAREFPMLAVFPMVPTAEGSTNQGKTALAETLGRAMLFDQCATRVPDSSSAPDSRTAAEPLRAKGTIILDEWVQPSGKAHVLCAENLQSLCVGRSVSVGRAMENAASVSLRHSITLSAKAVCLPPDLLSRVLPIYLGDLSEAQRADAELFRRISSGAIALDLLLAALSVIESARFQELWPGAARFATSRAYRFGWHRAIAVVMYMCETGASAEDAQEAVDTEARNLSAQVTRHTTEAVDSGLWDDLVGSQYLTLPITALVQDLLPQDCEAIAAYCAEHGDKCASPGTAVTCATLLRGRAALMGLEGRPLRALLPHFLPGSGAFSDSQIQRAVCRDVRARIKPGEMRRLPGVTGDMGWCLERLGDSGGVPRVRIVCHPWSPGSGRRPEPLIPETATPGG